MGYAAYIGRVGGLAVALGVGIAVATAPGVAWADDTGSAGSGGTAETAGTTGTSETTESEGSSTTGTTVATAGTSNAAVSHTDGDSTPGSGVVDAPTSGTSASTRASVRQVPPGMVLTTGGKDAPMKSSSDTSTQGDVVVEMSTVDPTAPKPVADSPVTPPEASAAQKASVSGPRGSDKKHRSLDEPTGAPGVDAYAATATGTAVRSRPEISQPPRGVVDVAVSQPAGPQAVTAVTARTYVPPQANVVAKAISAAPEEPTPPRSVSATVLGVLASAGWGPLATDSPITPIHSPLELALAAVATRPRRSGQAVAASSTLTSQPIAGPATVGVQEDPQALTKTSTTQLSAPLTIDAANVTTASQTRVQGKAADTTAPAVSLTGPAPGATVSGKVNLTATATDNAGGSGMAGVQFKLDGTQLLAEDPLAPYSTSWDTTAAANGTHTLTARAFDAAGNQTTSTAVSVTVNNPLPTPPHPR